MKYKVGDIVIIYWSGWTDLSLIVEIKSDWYHLYQLDTTSEWDRDNRIPFNSYKGSLDNKFRNVWYCQKTDKLQLVERNS